MGKTKQIEKKVNDLQNLPNPEPQTEPLVPETPAAEPEAKPMQMVHAQSGEEALNSLRNFINANGITKEMLFGAEDNNEVTQDPASADELAAKVAKLINQQNADDNDEVEIEEDEDAELFEGECIWNPEPVWTTVGYVAAAAALIGLGALLHRWLSN